MLVSKTKTAEYTFAAYAFITQLFIIGISALNLFKSYVTDTFLVAMGLFLILAIFYLALLVLCTKFVTAKDAPKWMIVPGILLVIATFTGNLFATLLGFSLIQKARKTNPSAIEKWQKNVAKDFT